MQTKADALVNKSKKVIGLTYSFLVSNGLGLQHNVAITVIALSVRKS